MKKIGFDSEKYLNLKSEKILERNADKTDSGRKLHASQMISSFTADFIAPRCTYETSGEIIFFSPDGEPSERSII